MKKIRLTLLMLMAFLLPFALQAQSTVEIGTGTSTGYTLPFNMYYNYSLTQQIYTADEIGMPGTISAIAFDYAYASELSLSNVRVYMKSVAKSSFESTTDMVDISDASLVYEGDFAATTSGWLTLTLSTPFEYNGTDNLLICFYDTTSGYASSSHKFKYSSTTDYCGIAYYSDTYVPDDADVTAFSGSKSRYQYHNNIRLTITPPAGFCPKPTGLACTAYTTTTATLSWTAGGSETSWTIEYGTAEDFTGATSVSVTGGTPTKELTGLTAETTYYARVKALCTDDSEWSNVISFTPSAIVMLTVNDGTVTNSYVPIYGNYVDNYDKCEFIIPAATLESMSYGSISAMKFYLSTPASASWGAANFQVFMKEVDETTISTFYGMEDATLVYEGSIDGTQSEMLISFTTNYTYNGGNLLIGVYNTVIGSFKSAYFTGVTSTGSSINGYNGSSLDNITSGTQRNFLPKTTFSYEPGEAPSCFKPTNVTIVDGTLTSNSVSIDWTDNNATAPANGWTLLVNNQEVAATEHPFQLTGLTPATTYTIKVKANCAADDASDWSGILSVVTECEIFNVTPDNPYVESFDDVTFPPVCWTREHTMGTATKTWVRNTSTVHTGAGSAQLEDQSTGNKNNLVTGELNIPEANAYQVTFWVYRSNYSTIKPNEGIKVWVNTTPDTIGATEIAYIHRQYTLAPEVEATGWYEYNAPIPTSGDMYVIFEGISEYGLSTYMDDIAVERIPTCLVPTELTLDSLTSTYAAISWTDNNTTAPQSWTVKFNGVDTTVTTNSIAFDNLTPATTYTIQIKANCTDDDESNWTPEGSFATECPEAFVVTAFNPFHEGFEGASVACWSVSHDSLTYNWGIHSGEEDAYEGSYCAIAPYQPGSRARLISPVIDLTQVENPVLSFYHMQPNPYDSVVDFLTVYYRTDENAEWVALADYTDLLNEYALETIELPNANATYQISFYSTGNDGWNIFLDEINITGEAIVEPCAVPTNVAVENNVVTWEGDAASYNVMVVVGEDTTTTTVTTTTYTIEGLEDGTEGTVAVQAVCAEDNISEWSEPVAFTFVGVGINNYGIQANIYPNPTTGNVTVESDAINADITVFDMFGKLMMTSKVASERTELDFNGFAPGVYMVRIANNNGTTTVKVVKE